MPQPKSKISRSRRGARRSHDAMARPSDSNCQNCGATVVSHRVCPSCGHYKGKEVVRPKA